MNLEITGKLLEKGETVQVKETFKKREFVLELIEEFNGQPSQYANYAKMQLVQQKCELLDRFNEGDVMKVNFSIKGNKYERDGKVSYFSNLDAWRLELADANNNTGNSGANWNQNPNQNPAGNGGSWSNAAPANSGFQQSTPSPVAPSSAPDGDDGLPF